MPNEGNLLAIADVQDTEPRRKSYLDRGGSIQAVFLGVCKAAMDADEWTGDGTLMEDPSPYLVTLPRCRNDHEYGFVSGMCGYRRISRNHFKDRMGYTLDEDYNRIDSWH